MTTSDVTALVAEGRGGWVARGLMGPTSDTLTRLCDHSDWLFVEVTVIEAKDKLTLMRSLADQLELPESFASTWEALADALRDLAGDHGGVVLRLKGLGEVPPPLAHTMVEVLDARVLEGPTPFVVVADPPLPEVSSAAGA